MSTYFGTVRKWARPEDLVFTLFILISMTLMLALSGRITIRPESLHHMAIGGFIWLLIASFVNLPPFISSGFKRKRDLKAGYQRTLRDYLPVLQVLLMYETVATLYPLVGKRLADPTLKMIDEAVFGVQPTVWLEKISTPLLTDYLTFTYMLYFFLPALVFVFFSVTRRRDDLRDLSMAVSLSLYMTYIGYLLVPTVGPKYFIPDAYSADLEGIFLYQRVEPFWELMRSTTTDCFPSHHTAMGVISLYYLGRAKDHSKPTLWVYRLYVLLVASLIFSTVYLRYHWISDIAAGLMVAQISVLIANRLNGFWKTRVENPSRRQNASSEIG